MDHAPVGVRDLRMWRADLKVRTTFDVAPLSL